MSNRHGPYRLGYTRATKVITKRSKNVNFSKSYKNYHSSDYSLKFENMKVKSLVIVNENVTVKMFKNLVHTARHAREFSLI